MQSFYKLLCIIFLFLPFCGNAQDWQWVNRPATWKSHFKEVSTGKNGNIYIGINQPNKDKISLEDTSGKKIQLNSFGILFLNPDGKFIRMAEIKSGNLNFSLVSNKVENGNIKIIGSAFNSFIFDTIKIQGTNNIYRQQIIFAECDTTGKWLSAKPIAVLKNYTSNEAFSQSEMDNQGNILLILHIADTLIINQNNLYTAKFPEVACAWIGKFSPQGDLLWGKKICQNEQATYYTSINQLAIDKHGNVYHGGSLWKNATNYGFLLYKYKPDGTLIYKRNIIQGNYYYFTFSNSLQIDSSDNIYLSGNFTGTITIGNKQLIADGPGIFTAKFDSSLNLLWAANSQGKGVIGCHSSAIDDEGNVYITGEAEDTTDFGNIRVNIPSKNGKSINTPFVAKFSSEGKAEWAYTPLTNGLSTGTQICIDECRNVIIDGVFTPPQSSDPQIKNMAQIQFGIHNLKNSGGNYIAKYSQRKLKIKQISYCLYDSLMPEADTTFKFFKWQFSNDQIIKGKNIIYAPDSPGWYKIKLTATTAKGCIQHTEDSFYFATSFINKNNLELFYATVTSNTSAKIAYKKIPAANNYLIYRSQTGTDYQYIATTTDSFFEDTKLECNTYSYAYEVIAADKCGNTVNSSNYAKTILLQGENLENQFAVLSWSPYEVWNEDVKEYCLETKDSNNAWRALSCNQNLQSEIQDYAEEGKSEKCYRIRAKENNGNQQQSLSNEVCLSYIPTIWIPNAFSPNYDGLNDTFKILTLGITECKLTIYNRWGEQVFISDNIDNCWTGQDGKVKFPDGEYLYILKAKGINKENIYKNGSILLMR